MNWSRTTAWYWQWRHCAFAIAFIAAAAALRIWPLQALETRAPWLTFYPAVMVAAIYGGLSIGLLATCLSCLTVVFLWFLLSAQPFIREPADWLGMAVFFLNCVLISCVAEAMRRAQTRAKLAQEKAELANRSKSVFLANMSHELRTPLNAILGFSCLMRDEDGISDEQRKTLDIINDSGEHLLTLINNVLDMAKIEAGRTVAEDTVFDLHALMWDIAELMRQQAEAKGLQLTLKTTAELPHVVKADESKLRQVVLNLIGNAVKFTSRGGVTLSVEARPLDGSGSPLVTLVVDVEDTGDGIAAKDQQRIFEPFVQVGRVSDQKGTGLGLTITRQFVELMGGVIQVESAPGKGSKFRVEMPVEPVEVAAAVLGGVSDAHVAHLASDQPEYRILIVEDLAENRELLRQLLERSGFHVRVAVNGAEGVETFQSWRPQFIWMDWRMPVMDGWEAPRRIRELEGGRDVKIVALSASVLKEEREQVLAAGADDFVPKPIQFKRIYDCMARHLGVRFISDGTPPPVATVSLGNLEREALALLPSSLRTELLNALVSLDIARIAEVTRRVAEVNPALGGVLEQLVGQFHYTAILQALKPRPANASDEEVAA